MTQQTSSFSAYDGWEADLHKLALAEIGQPDPRGGHGEAAHRLLAGFDPPKCKAVLMLDYLRRFPIEGTECTLEAGHGGDHHHNAVWVMR
jgi:hypothetical protein